MVTTELAETSKSARLDHTDQSHSPAAAKSSGTALAETPRPYKAILAICSDLDETPDKEVYYEMMKFLNTSENTIMGPGVNLEVGNTIYFDMPPGQFSYWNTDERGREMIHALIRSGHIDCLHSFGDLARTRAAAARALDNLARNDCWLKVWVDHAVAPTNFGDDIMQGHGDEEGHAAYHADLSFGYGIKYIWCGRVTSVIGQDQPLSMRGIADWKHPLGSTRTILKECSKQFLARVGSTKYAMHRQNRLVRKRVLRDRSTAWEFMRCNPYWNGLGAGSDTGYGIADVLTRRFLDRLVERGSSSILYTHLGKLSSDSPRSFNPRTVAAFRLLAEYYHAGKILVTTTRRLLDHWQYAPAAVDNQDTGARTHSDNRQLPGKLGEKAAGSLDGSWTRLSFPSCN
jgi:hypothetical protein